MTCNDFKLQIIYLLKSSIAICLTAIFAIACAPTTNAPRVGVGLAAQEAALQRELAVKEKIRLNQRLNDVAQPIMVSNTQMCGKLVSRYIGVSFLTRDLLSNELKSAYEKVYGIRDNPTVVLVAKGAPAEGVLQWGDVITHMDGKTVPKGARGIKFISKSLKDKKTAVPVVVTIKRNAETLNVQVVPLIACDSPVYVAELDEVNAMADGKSILVTRGMMRLISTDEELAAIIGHELAHNSRRHLQAKQGNAVLGTIIGAAISVAIGVDVTRIGTSAGAVAHSHGFETEADYVGLYHAARAGFEIENMPNFWRRFAAENPKAFGFKGGSHPSSAKRFLVLEATVKEIKNKQELGVELIPEEKRASALAKGTS